MSFTRWLYIIRHGETDFNLKGIIQGRGVDTRLNATGQRQASLFHARYGEIHFDKVIASSLTRSYETVLPFQEKGYSIEKVELIDEIHWGEYEGRPSTPELHRQYRSIVSAWNTGDLSRRVPGGESASDLASRLRRFTTDLLQRPEERTLICTHGRTLRCLMCLLLGQPVKEMESFEHANTGLYLVRVENGSCVIERRNDLSHLTGNASIQ